MCVLITLHAIDTQMGIGYILKTSSTGLCILELPMGIHSPVQLVQQSWSCWDGRDIIGKPEVSCPLITESQHGRGGGQFKALCAGCTPSAQAAQGSHTDLSYSRLAALGCRAAAVVPLLHAECLHQGRSALLAMALADRIWSDEPELTNMGGKCYFCILCCKMWKSPILEAI